MKKNILCTRKKWQQAENVLKTKTFFNILPDLIQSLSRGMGGGEVGLKRGSRGKKIVFTNQRDG